MVLHLSSAIVFTRSETLLERGDEVRFACRGVAVVADVCVRFLEHYVL